ncbi:hypothetical protein OVY01_02825 [Robbsia sp. Bb-Pol-6]|uniref:Uncharacterized protein n=1 Tax=Robbsia betulipollinis TaxID=2981849 RepID=A0ABT3ZI44_9BURK|nr:hypothetical protein [Robbsia betulipollinis]MCY0386196.1 hypothetical protein [Robbsia betulipollinis]
MLNHDGLHSTAERRGAGRSVPSYTGETNEPHIRVVEARFLRAWRQSVTIVGARYFGSGRIADLAKASSKWDLVPRLATIRHGVGTLERTEQMFLSALLSLYNPHEAVRLRKQCGLSDFLDLNLLDPVRRELLSELLLNSTGW